MQGLVNDILQFITKKQKYLNKKQVGEQVKLTAQSGGCYSKLEF